MNGNIWGFEGLYFLKPDSLYKGKKVVILYETDNPSQGQVFVELLQVKQIKKLQFNLLTAQKKHLKLVFHFSQYNRLLSVGVNYVYF